MRKTLPPTLFVAEYQRFGPIFRIEGQMPCTVLAGPEANVFLAREGARCLTPVEHFTAFNRELGLPPSQEGEAHRRWRALRARGYSQGMVVDSLEQMIAIARAEVDRWRPGDLVPVLPAMRRIASEQLGRLLVHHSPAERLTDLVTFFQTAVGVTLLHAQPESALTSPDYHAARERTFEMARRIVAEHRERPNTGRQADVVDDVLAAATKDPDQFSEADVLEAALGPLLAGLETVVSRASFLLHALLRQPETLERVVAGADQFIGEGLPTWERLRRARPIVGAALESLRAYPAPLVFGYTAGEPFTIAGCDVPAGEPVVAGVTVAHWLPEVYADPARFDVDRYHEPRNEHRRPGAFAPFGVSEHRCLGAGVAEIQLMVIIATVASMVTMELEHPATEYEPDMLAPDFRVRVVHRR